MKNKPRAYRLIILAAALAFVAFASVFLVAMRDAAVSPVALVLPLAVAGSAFLLGALFAVGSLGRNFATPLTTLAQGDDAEPYERALAALGASPLNGLIRFMLLVLAYLAAIGLGGGAFGLSRELAGAAHLFLLSIGMLAASFAFVLADKLVLTTLLSQGVTRYPSSLREARQRRKNFIIPLFMSLMSLLFAFSRSLMLFARAPEGARIGYYAAGVFLPALFYFSVVIVLLAIWSSSTALLYRSVHAQLEGLSQGERDLRSRVRVGSVDEIAFIGGMVNAFCDGLAEGIRNLERLYAELSAVQGELIEGIGASSSAAVDIGTSVAGAIEAIGRGDEALQAVLAQSRELAALASDLAGKARDQATGLAASRARIGEVLADVGSLASRASSAAEKSAELAVTLEAGEAAIRASADAANAVAQRGADLSEINRLIAAVAAKTNLLAMNAAIEAAHAGEAGAGFSVVASEIRALAESTAEHTRRNKESLAEILGLIRGALESAERAGAAFAALKASSASVNTLQADVARAMGAEEERSREILGLLAATEDLGRGVADAARALDGIAEKLASGFERAASSSADATRRAQAMRERSEELTRATQKADALAARVAELDERMAAFVRSFKT